MSCWAVTAGALPAHACRQADVSSGRCFLAFWSHLRRRLDESRRHPALATGLVATMLVFVAAPIARGASSFSWYGSGSPNSNQSCWQQGVPSPAPSGVATPSTASTTCPSIDLAHHTVGGPGAVGGGIGADLDITQAGDYCNYYRIGDDLQRDPYDHSGLTGFSPALSPRRSYQRGDGTRNGNANVCQSTGAEWGQGLVANNVAATNETCGNFCGIHHYASFNGTIPNGAAINNRPWDAWFGDPSLVVSTEVNVKTFAVHTGTVGSGWGFVCPQLRDTTSGWWLEYCIQAWRNSYGSGLVACGTGKGGNDQVITSLPSGTDTNNWASVYTDSANDSTNTFDLGQTQLPSGWRRIAASISPAQLTNALSAIKSPAHCGGVPLSSDPRDYQLIGVEHGLEVGGTWFAAGQATENLQLFTTYTVSNAPTNVSPPSLPGTPTVNSPSTANPGSWSSNPASYAYQWSRCDSTGANCARIAGATASTYTPGTGDIGSRLTVTVAAGSAVSATTNLAWSAPITSAPSASVRAASGTGGALRVSQPSSVQAKPPSPNVAQLRRSLLGQLAPDPNTATIARIRAAGGYRSGFEAPVAGTVAITWYQVPDPSHPVANEPAVVATARRTIGTAGKGTIAIDLTKDGRNLLRQAKSRRLTAEGVFTPLGGNPVSVTKAFSIGR
jgi:hypothetical protein